MELKLCRVLALLCWVSESYGRIGFKKDQSLTKIAFPPKNILGNPGSTIPIGHMRPLGWQTLPSGKVVEEEGALEPEVFYKNYVLENKPVVFKQALTKVPAAKKWQKDEYLRNQYGDIDVHVVVKKELIKEGPKKLKFKKFLREYHYEDWYLSNVVPQEMMHELLLPKHLKCGMRKHLLESEIWMASGGTSSLLHTHVDHGLHCLMPGRKDFILIDQKYKDNLSFRSRHAGHKHHGAGYSMLDSERINMYNHKELYKIPWTWSILEPGDCIFVPADYLHQVRSHGRSFSSTVLWAPSDEYDFKDCKKMDLDKTVPLSETTLMWTYVGGERQLANNKLNARSLKHHLLVIMRQEETLTYDLFQDFYEEVMLHDEDEEEDEDHTNAYASRIWQHLAPRGADVLTRAQVKALKDDALEPVAAELNRRYAHKRDEL